MKYVDFTYLSQVDDCEHLSPVRHVLTGILFLSYVPELEENNSYTDQAG
jgi:hypothetical protein